MAEKKAKKTKLSNMDFKRNISTEKPSVAEFTETKQKKIKTERKVKPEEKTDKVVIKEVLASKKKEKKVYRVTGSFLMGNRHQTFTKEVMASDPREKIYSDFGSRHNVKRRNIKIEEVKELKNDEITDHLLKQMVKMVGV